MKRKILLLLFSAGASLLFARGMEFFSNTELETTYTNNALKLSNYDLKRFEDGNENKFKLETSDDLIISQRLEIGLKHHLFAGHTQIGRIVFKFNKHLQNGILDDGYLGISVRQYLSRRFNFQLSYFYYPEIYVNRYRSVLDNSNIYRDFTYSKNSYSFAMNWKAHELAELTYRSGFTQLFYNKYFTEYDAINFDNKITASLFPRSKIRTSLAYEYKVSNADGADAFADPTSVEVIKDASYQANRYSLGWVIPRLYKVGKNHLYLQTGMDYEERYFQNDDEVDQYHFRREDYVFSVDAALSCKVAKKIGLKISGKYEERNTRSPFASVKRDKSYDLLEAGLRIRFDF